MKSVTKYALEERLLKVAYPFETAFEFPSDKPSVVFRRYVQLLPFKPFLSDSFFDIFFGLVN